MKTFSVRLILFVSTLLLSTNLLAQFNYHLGFEKTIGGLKNQAAVFLQKGIVVQRNDVLLTTKIDNDTSMHLPFKTNNFSGSDILLMKYDSTGTLKWQKIIGSSQFETLPNIISVNDSSIELSFESMGKDSDITCYYVDSNNNVNSSVQIFSFENATGSIQNKQCLGSNFSGSSINAAFRTKDNGYLIKGRCRFLGPSASSSNYLVIKTDSLLNVQWHYCIDSLGSTDFRMYELANHNFLFYGSTSLSTFYGAPSHFSDVGIICLSNSGALLWAKAYGSDGIEKLNDVLPIKHGGCVFTGYTNLSTSSIVDSGDVQGYHGKADIWLVQLDSMGAIVRQKCIGSNLDEVAKSIIARREGGYFLAGNTKSTNISGDSLNSHGQEDAFIVAVDTNFNYLKGQCYGGSGRDYFQSIVIHPDSSIWGWGYTDSYDGDVSINYGGNDYWLVRLVPDSILGLPHVIVNSHDILLYPNPGLGIFNLEFKNGILPQQAQLQDVRGKTLMNISNLQRNQKINISSLPNGVYVLCCSYASGELIYKKLVVMR